MDRILALILFCAINSGCSVCYVAKQGYYQAKMLYGAQAIDKVLQRPDLPAEQKHKLELIQKVSKFAHDYMALRTGKNYTTVNLDFNYRITSVSAAPALSLEPYTWWFPILGRVPYLGYFDPDDAKKESEKLAAQGYDIYVRQVGAYSTLGYFQDPVLPSMFELSDAVLAGMIIHEIAHSTVYFPGFSDFNESFANFVGRQGALAYIRHRMGEDNDAYRETSAYFHDEDRYAKWMLGVCEQLEKLYTSPLPDADKFLKKAEILASMPTGYKQVPFESKAYQEHVPEPMNNAHLMAYKLYNNDQAIFDQLLKQSNGEWKAFIQKMSSLQTSKDPLADLKKLVGTPAA